MSQETLSHPLHTRWEELVFTWQAIPTDEQLFLLLCAGVLALKRRRARKLSRRRKNAG
jgi:hypothetical protein